MRNTESFFIGGQWVAPLSETRCEVFDPATEQPFARIALANPADIDRAVAAAKAAFPAWSATTREERLALLRRILELYAQRLPEVAALLTREMGAPARFAREAQAQSGVNILEKTIGALESFRFEYPQGTTLIRREPIGVCGLITPWNWPINQLVLKVAAALAAGCTMVVKPSELAPFAAMAFAEVVDKAGCPAGVFNLVNGEGPVAGEALASHPDVAMVSITGSTRAGAAVARAAAETVKRVTQELGGKSANILLPGTDIAGRVTRGVQACFRNTGQSCTAPARILVPQVDLPVAEDAARKAAEALRTGDPNAAGTDLGPVISAAQHGRIQRYIELGIAEGAKLLTGGSGRPEGLNRGWYVRPTVFSAVTPAMTIAREEIFGPVLALMPYRDVEHAVEIANDTVYGLSNHVQGDPALALEVAKRLRSGQVLLNYPAYDAEAPFGGYGQSGNGREQGKWGIEEFLEIKAIVGAVAA